MTVNPFDPNDPLWTAYVLGELSPEEAADVERQISTSVTAREHISELQALTGQVKNALQAGSADATGGLSPERVADILKCAGPSVQASVEEAAPRPVLNPPQSAGRSGSAMLWGAMTAVSALIVLVAFSLNWQPADPVGEPRLAGNGRVSQQDRELLVYSEQNPDAMLRLYGRSNLDDLSQRNAYDFYDQPVDAGQRVPGERAPVVKKLSELEDEAALRGAEVKPTPVASSVRDVESRGGDQESPSTPFAVVGQSTTTAREESGPANVDRDVRFDLYFQQHGLGDQPESGESATTLQLHVVPNAVVEDDVRAQLLAADSKDGGANMNGVMNERLLRGSKENATPTPVQRWGYTANGKNVTQYDSTPIPAGRDSGVTDGLSSAPQKEALGLDVVTGPAPASSPQTPVLNKPPVVTELNSVLPEQRQSQSRRYFKAVQTEAKTDDFGVVAEQAEANMIDFDFNVNDAMPAVAPATENSTPAAEGEFDSTIQVESDRILLESEQEQLQKPHVVSELEGWEESRRGRKLSELDVAETAPANESYSAIVENPFQKVREQPLSTFGLDVDTGAFTNVRRFLYRNQMPPANAVRTEELMNIFDFDLQEPDGDQPLAITLESGPCYWNSEHHLVRVGLKAKEISRDKRPAASLVFLIDSSGSMSDSNKLPLVQAGLRLLVEQMEEQDRIAIVTYANEARVVLESTSADQKDRILQAIDSLHAEGSTNGAGGLELAYQVASKDLNREKENRVLLCTDGDFNVGVSDDSGVFELIEDHRESGVFLSVLGFGTGNLKDSKLEGVASRGNGHYVYVDQLQEAQRIFVEQLTGTLFTVAKDVKLQVEFNPHKVDSYRLIGFENRMLKAQDFQNDRIDSGEIGAGHSVVALYEITPAGVPEAAENLRYQSPKVEQPTEEKGHGEEWLFVKLRYKRPAENESTQIEVPLPADELGPGSEDLQWAAGVAMFGMLAHDSEYRGNGTWESLVGHLRDSLGDRSDPLRIEFLDVAIRARGIWRREQGEESYTLTELPSLQAREKAGCEGKYQELLDKFAKPDDGELYGEFLDLGYRAGENYLPRAGAPDGYWVYVYPEWYVWGEATGVETLR